MGFSKTNQHYVNVYRAIILVIAIGPLTIIASNILIGSLFSATNIKHHQINVIQNSLFQVSTKLSNYVDEAESYLQEADKNLEQTDLLKPSWANNFALYIKHLKLDPMMTKLRLPNLDKIANLCVKLVVDNEAWKVEFNPTFQDIKANLTLNQVRELGAYALNSIETIINETRLLHSARATSTLDTEQELICTSNEENDPEFTRTATTIELLELLWTLKLELIKIDSAIESIASTTSLEELREITTKRLSPIPEKTIQIIANLTKIDPTKTNSLHDRITKLYEKLFGADFNYNTVGIELMRGKGGLLALYENFFSQIEMHKILTEKIKHPIYFLKQEIKHIDRQTEELTTQVVVDIREELHASLKQMLGLSIASLSVYVILSLIALRTLRKQNQAYNDKCTVIEGSNEQLHQSNRSLQDALTLATQMERNASIANTLHGEFFANLNRNIRAPLSGMLGMLRVILSGQLPEELPSEHRKCILTIERSASSVLTLLNDLVDCALLYAHKLDVELVNFDLSCTLEQVISSLNSNDPPSLLLNLRNDIPKTLVGDPARIGQILHSIIWQLLQNKTNAGSIVVRVAKTSETPKQVKLQFSIVDPFGLTTPDRIALIEMAFLSEETSVIKAHGSKGLSLVTAKRLISLMGGQTWLENKQEEGFTIHFTLPIQKQRSSDKNTHQFNTSVNFETDQSGTDSESTLTNNEEKAVNNQQAIPPKHITKILLIENDELYKELASQLLKQAGYETIYTPTGKLALPILAQEEIGMIFINVYSDEVDGLCTTRAIRSSEIGTNIHLPIVGFTISANKQEREECLACGFDDYITKPMTTLGIQGIIERNLGNKNT